MTALRYRLDWPGPDVLVAYEPTPAEVERHAPALAAAYNDPHHRAMLAHTTLLGPADVVSYYQQARREGGRTLLLERAGALAGDADVRHIGGGSGEAAILIAAREDQGRGLGTRFGIMLHAFAAKVLHLERLFASIVPANVASQRLFARLGYVPDDGHDARRFAEADDDVTLSLRMSAFTQRFAVELSEIRVATRS